MLLDDSFADRISRESNWQSMSGHSLIRERRCVENLLGRKHGTTADSSSIAVVRARRRRMNALELVDLGLS